MNRPILHSYVYHNDRAWFVSTIEREYDIPFADGRVNGFETLVYEWCNGERGRVVQAGCGVHDHLEYCLSLHLHGHLPGDDET